MAAPKSKDAEIVIKPLQRATLKLRIIGTSPLYQNRMSAKVRQGLLVGAKKKTRAERVEIKHDVLEEFRSTAEVAEDGPTALGILTTAVKGAMQTAALETAGVTKASTQRLLSVPTGHFALYGTPKLKIDIVRSADIAKTPDMRTRCFLPRWAAAVEVSYITPQFGANAIVNLLANAGVLVGIGDFRQEKGKGSYGSFRVIGDQQEDEEWDDLVANHAREVQQAALENPECADAESQDLFDFWAEEVNRRAA